MYRPVNFSHNHQAPKFQSTGEYKKTTTKYDME